MPELDFVMEKDGELIGHVMCSRSEIMTSGSKAIPIMTFGPISIAPGYKRQGYGKRLLDYSMEKALKALLAIKGKDANTHNGILQLFNRYFIYEDNTEFNKADYKLYASIELIRTASDYDDFYIASKRDTEDVLDQVEYLNEKIYNYIEENFINKQIGENKKVHNLPDFERENK